MENEVQHESIGCCSHIDALMPQREAAIELLPFSSHINEYNSYGFLASVMRKLL
jgi:hypothetical protein